MSGNDENVIINYGRRSGKTVEEQISGILRNAEENTKAAYLRGYKNGLNDGNDAYNDGLNDAEKAIKRIVNEPSRGGLYANEMQEIFGTKGTFVIFLKYSISEIIEKIREYDERKQQEESAKAKASDDEIHVGDEICLNNSARKYIVTAFLDNGKLFVLEDDGFTVLFDCNEIHKTGRNYPIKEILRKLNESNESEE